MTMPQTALEGFIEYHDEACEANSIEKGADLAAVMVEFSDLFIDLIIKCTDVPTSETAPILAEMNARWQVPTTRRSRGSTQRSANGGGG